MSSSIILELDQSGLYTLIFKRNGKQVGQAYRDVDGFYYFIPKQNASFYSADLLYAIADILKSLNAEMEEKIFNDLMN